MRKNIPISEDDFYLYICKRYLNIVPITYEDIKKKIFQISKDINEIDKLYNVYINERKEIETKKYEGKIYKLKILDYYIKKLSNAQKEILNYLEIFPYNFMIGKNRHDSIFFDEGYMFAYNSRDYNKDYLSVLSNKLQDIYLQRYYELEKLYQKNKTDFFLELKKEINPINIIKEINNNISINHRLNVRKQILKDIMTLFLKNKFELFCNIVPLQIEGIIYDYCLENGINEKSILESSLTEKLNKLQEINENVINFEYYSFIFPIIRNRVAHGKKLKEDLELQSWLLLLDLQDVCNLMMNEKLQININLSSIKKANKDPNLKNLLALDNVFLNTLNDFYKKDNKLIPKLKNKLHSFLSIENFNKEFSNIKEKEVEILLNQIKNIKKAGINVNECNKIIKLLNIENKSKNK